MAPTRRKDVLSRRRRRTDDDGEEEGSQAGDLEDDSLSEASVPSDDDADADASDVSDEESVKPDVPVVATTTTKNVAPTIAQQPSTFPEPTSDAEAMMNGLKRQPHDARTEELHFDDAATIPKVVPQAEVLGGGVTKPKANGIRRENPVERNRKDHETYLKERRENPAFVPNRGGFFLHDNRASPTINGFRQPIRGRGRGRGNFGAAGYGRTAPEPTAMPWTHDLHDTIAQPTQHLNISSTLPIKPGASTSSAPPPRTFNTTVVLGSVPAVVYMPGMKERMTVKTIAKKQHTLLPNHRPPLRRDKPVRVSIPDAPPRYIFPAVERSFIFIPRALRPNQQAFARGRGRGSYHGSRRTSVYGGSTYTPSVAMSRRSSFGRGFGGDELRSPGGTMLPRGPVAVPEVVKPVVRLPPSVQTGPLAETSLPHANGTVPMASVLMPPPNYIPSHEGIMSQRQLGNIPMHQPSPRKAVSVNGIEAPGNFAFNPPPQQAEQPFHQQVPTQSNGGMYIEEGFMPHSRHPSHPSQPSGTPLSQIPEGAIHAQPFQPFPMAPPGYVASPYPPGGVFYPPSSGELPAYHPGTAPSFVPQTTTVVPFMVPAAPPAAPPAGDPNAGQTVAHESNGMVYYYESSQMPSAPGYGYPMAPQGGVMGMGGMMTPPGGFYYSPAPGGIYYAPQ